jgi:hypothetical protein
MGKKSYAAPQAKTELNRGLRGIRGFPLTLPKLRDSQRQHRGAAEPLPK